VATPLRRALLGLGGREIDFTLQIPGAQVSGSSLSDGGEAIPKPSARSGGALRLRLAPVAEDGGVKTEDGRQTLDG